MEIIGYLKELGSFNDLLWTWVTREVRARYKQSLFGIAWAILQPIATTIIFVVIFSFFMKIPSDNIPYPIFVYAAMLPWNFFTRSVASGVGSIVNNMNLVTKIYFPREILPMSSIFQNFVDFLAGLAVLAVLMIAYRVQVTWAILIFPVLFVTQIIFTASVSFISSALNVYYRDVNQMMSLILQLWMYACPVIYPTSVIPAWLLPWYMLNPMAFIIDAYRKVLIKGEFPDPLYLAMAIGVSIIALLISYVIFKRMEDQFADVI